MPIDHKIIQDQGIAYIKAWGKITAVDIMSDGAAMFGEPEWQNGFSIICDYREISDFSIDNADINNIIAQDKQNDVLLSKSKCAVVAEKDLIYGFSRMWEILSVNTKLTSMVFRNIDDAFEWLGLNANVIELISKKAGTMGSK